MAYKWKQGAEALKTFSHDSHKKLTLQCTQVLFSVSINSLLKIQDSFIWYL